MQQLPKGYGDLCAPPSRKLAVDGISATSRPGVVTGFLGPNGAGKSTTMRSSIMVSLARRSALRA